MPHCDLKLYENIIGANWSEEQLARIIFVANRFKDYTDNYPQSKLEVESPFLMRLGGIDHHNNKYWLFSRSIISTTPRVPFSSHARKLLFSVQ
jgi:hypothetical protein